VIDTESYFLGILRNFLHGEKNVIPPEGLDWDKLLQLARIHRVEGIVYHQIINGCIQTPVVPEHIRKKLFLSFADTCCHYAIRTRLAKELDKVFRQENIPYIIVKGIDIAELWPSPKLRTTQDIDLVVHAEDKSRVHELLLSCGWENMSRQMFEWTYAKNGCVLELHHCLFYYAEMNAKPLQKYFADCWEFARQSAGSSRYHLERNFYFAFLLVHLYKHFFSCGVGFRFFLDIAIFLQNGGLDWERLEKDLRSIGIWDFTKICLAFCRKWFDISVPIETEELPNDFYLDSTAQIMKNGLFGETNEKNRNSHEIYMLKKGSSTWKVWLPMFFEVVFPSYDLIRSEPVYSYVDGKPFLMPVVWLHRFFLRFWERKTMPQIFFIFQGIDKQLIQEKKRFYDQWKI